ncbi:NAD(P)-binding protein [Xylariaceae sp. FL1272]|nr:NAD(P)-binding protein [Xylariaceae sp. FL1272]
MSFNRIAILGHNGWAGSAVLRALASTGAPIKVLHRAGSDVSQLPAGVTSAEIDLDDPNTLIPALKNIDIALSFTARDGIPKQKAFIQAIPSTDVKLFVPSDLGFKFDDQGLQIVANRTKKEVEDAAKAAGVPITVVWVGCFTESTLAFPIMGVDVRGNRLIVTGDSLKQQLSFATRKYVAAAYASIFAQTPPSQLAGRHIGIFEFKATGEEIAAAMRERNGTEPEKFSHSLDKVDDELTRSVAAGSPTAMSWHLRKAWGLGEIVPGIGNDIWEVDGYKKTTLRELLVENKLGAYKELPPPVEQMFYSAFQ